MEFLMGALEWYSALPASVMVMIGIFLVALLLARQKAGAALRAAIYVAAAVVAMGALVGMFSGAATPILQEVVKSTGLKLDVIDLGVGSSYSNVLFPLSFYSILLVVGLGVNALMIVLKLTDTFDVDVFNYSVWALASSYVLVITENIILAIVAFVIYEIVVLKFADWTAPAIQEAYGLDGVSIPHGNAVIFAPVGMAVNWVIEKIPPLAKIDWSPEKIEERFGGFASPSMIGFVMGIILGIAGKQSFGQSLLLGVTIAAFMIVFPRVENVLVEGITPVADGMRDLCAKKFHRELNIGLDAAILIGMPDIMAAGILVTPVILLLAFILPGNHVLPMADLAIAAPFLISCCLPFCKRNIFRGFIAGIVVMIIALYICTFTADWYTAAAALNGLPFESTSTTLGICSSWVAWLIGLVFSIF